MLVEFKIIEKQEGCENPIYDAGIRNDGNGETQFGSVEEATEFWKKRNWSPPGPDRIVNFWWKKGELYS